MDGSADTATKETGWKTKTDGTPSKGTGPNGGSKTSSTTAKDGPGYVYYEASGSPPLDKLTSTMKLPKFAAPTGPGCRFSFEYHMFGKEEEMTSIEVLSDKGNVLKLDGPKNAKKEDGPFPNQGSAWKLTSAPLPEGTTKVSIVGTKASDKAWAGDAAIDNVRVTCEAATPAAATAPTTTDAATATTNSASASGKPTQTSGAGGAATAPTTTNAATATTNSASAPGKPAQTSGAGGAVSSGPFGWACKYRVRKDWMDLTPEERTLYLKAVNTLKTTLSKTGEPCPADCKGLNIYDTFVMIHGETANKAYAHQTAGFLPWHRKYLLEFETAIRTLKGDEFKCVTIPYWDWASETYSCGAKNLDKTLDCSTYHGASQLLSDFGGPGDETKSGSKCSGTGCHGSSGSGAVGCMTNGPFKGWVDHEGRCLSRGVNWNVAAQKAFAGRHRLAQIVQKYTKYGSQYGEGFRVVMEGIPHGSTHNYLGGHMRSFISPADPIFFSHHAYIDKFWAAWQDCHDFDEKGIKDKIKAAPDDKKHYKYVGRI